MKIVLRSRGSAPQVEFANSDAKFPAFVGGFGSGKTEALIQRAMRLKWQYPKQNIAYYLPTYDLVKQIGYPRFEGFMQRARIRYSLNQSDHVIRINGRGKIIFRTLDNPARIVGYEVADSLIDELDTLKTEDARTCWRQIIARNRQKKPDGSPNTVAVGTTPEGFRLVYQQWKQRPAPGYELIRASTYSNAHNLPEDYIASLQAIYPPQLLAAYLEGEFVNLTSGSVYPNFCRVRNHTGETIRPGEALHIGQDFNVYNCTSIVCVIRDGKPVALDELTGIRDTPAVCETIKQRFPGHHVTIYPDASGQSNKTVNASLSDLQILRDAGFSICVNSANPLVKDRVAAMNGSILNGNGERRLLVNTEKCPTLTECLEQQVYDKNGEPDKSDGKDHAPDALGYFISYRWPIVRPVISRNINMIHMSR